MNVRLLGGSLLVLVGLAHANWQGAKMVRGSDSLTYYYSVCASATDNSGHPWLVWYRWRGGIVNAYRETSRWDGSNWEPPSTLRDTTQPTGGYNQDMVFDQDNKLFFVWGTEDQQDRMNIWSSRYDSVLREWDLPKQVNDVDTTQLDDACCRISIGGGQTWATWSNQNQDSVTCDIKAARWNRDSLHWEPEMTVNPDTGGINRLDWFSDIAVDTAGEPHVVWTKATPSIPGVLLYSRYENGTWTPPVELTDPDTFIVGGPYGGTRPRLVADDQNNLYCAFNGARSGGDVVGVYWCRCKSQSGWTPATRIDTFTPPVDPVWDRDIAVTGPDNIWMVYDRGGGNDWRIYAQHFDGAHWSGVDRIDDGKTYEGGFAHVTLDGDGCPFVAWVADTTRSGQAYAVWFNRLLPPAGKTEHPQPTACAIQLSAYPNPFSLNMLLRCVFPSNTHTARLEIYDISGQLVRDFAVRQAAGGTRQAVVSWDGTDARGRKLANGVYLVRLETGDGVAVTKQVLLLR